MQTDNRKLLNNAIFIEDNHENGKKSKVGVAKKSIITNGSVYRVSKCSCIF